MRMTVLAYTGVGDSLTVEFSMGREAADGTEEPLKFMGRTHVVEGQFDELELSQQVWHVAKTLSQMALDLT